MNTFGKSNPKVILLDLSENQFEIYQKISPNYSHSFLFESLTGPEVLAETSVMGFDPKIIVKGYTDRIEIQPKIGKKETIQTNNPFTELKKLLSPVSDQSYRYLGASRWARWPSARPVPPTRVGSPRLSWPWRTKDWPTGSGASAGRWRTRSRPRATPRGPP